MYSFNNNNNNNKALRDETSPDPIYGLSMLTFTTRPHRPLLICRPVKDVGLSWSGWLVYMETIAIPITNWAQHSTSSQVQNQQVKPPPPDIIITRTMC